MSDLLDEINKKADQFAGSLAISAGAKRVRFRRAQVSLKPHEPTESDNPIEDNTLTLARENTICYAQRWTHRNQFIFTIATYQRSESTPKHFASWEEFRDCKDPWVQWLQKYTDLDEWMFDLAKKNPNIFINFTIDWRKLVEAQGSPYLTYESVLAAQGFYDNKKGRKQKAARKTTIKSTLRNPALSKRGKAR